ncbi:hypothetical protein ACVWXR_003238 [Pseudomonas lurida]
MTFTDDAFFQRRTRVRAVRLESPYLVADAYQQQGMRCGLDANTPVFRQIDQASNDAHIHGPVSFRRLTGEQGDGLRWPDGRSLGEQPRNGGEGRGAALCPIPAYHHQRLPVLLHPVQAGLEKRLAIRQFRLAALAVGGPLHIIR